MILASAEAAGEGLMRKAFGHGVLLRRHTERLMFRAKFAPRLADNLPAAPETKPAHNRGHGQGHS